MRGGQGRQPLDVPFDGRVSTACSLECPAWNHVHGWTIWGGYGTLPLKPRFLVVIDRSQVARRRVRLDLGDLGIIEQQLTSARTSLVPKPLPSCDAFASDWSIPAHTWIGFFFPPSVPASKSNVLGHQSAPFSIAMYGVTDSCAKTLGKYCSCTSASVGRFFSAPPLTI